MDEARRMQTELSGSDGEEAVDFESCDEHVECDDVMFEKRDG